MDPPPLPPTTYIDTEFATHLDENIRSLLHTMFAISGKHRINSQKATRWVQAQKTPLKRKVARHFIRNTTYVTFREYFNGIGQLVKTHYAHITQDAQKYIFLCVGSPKKSYYFSAIIAMHFIRKYGFREPTHFIRSVFKENTQDPMLLFDDMSYSGSQMSDMLTKLYHDCVPKYTTDEAAAVITPNIHILLYGLNTHSHRRLTTIERVKFMVEVEHEVRGVTFFKKQMQFKNVPSPFHVYYVKKFPLLFEVDMKDPMDMYHLVNYFFAPYLRGNPPLSIYFDHKIADDVSTYMKVLAYGPIIPGSYAISTRNDHMQEVRDIFGEYLSINNDNVEKLTGSELCHMDTEHIGKILQKYTDQDPEDPEDTRIQFAPFLDHCTINPSLNEQVKGMTYNEFLFPEHEINDMNVSDEITETPKHFADMVRRSAVLHDDRYKCIQPFYKLYPHLRANPPLTSSIPTSSSTSFIKSMKSSMKKTKSSKKTQKRRHSIGGVSNKSQRRYKN